MSKFEAHDKTVSIPFDRIPNDGDKPMFQVNAGMDSFFAISMADALTDSVRTLLQKSVAHEGMDVDAACLCAFALETAQALRAAAGVEA